MSVQEAKKQLNQYPLFADKMDGKAEENLWALAYSDYYLSATQKKYNLQLLFKKDMLVSIFINDWSANDTPRLSPAYKNLMDDQARTLSTFIPFAMEKYDRSQIYTYNWSGNSVKYGLNAPGSISIYYMNNIK